MFGAHVTCEVTGLRERRSADRTAVWTMSGVHSSVTDQRGTVDESCRTYVTNERTNRRCDLGQSLVGNSSRGTPTSTQIMKTMTCGTDDVIRRRKMNSDVID